MTPEMRLKRLELDPETTPDAFAMYDHAGRPLNDLARRRGNPDGPTFTVRIDRAHEGERDC